jgi:hypothetical protein
MQNDHKIHTKSFLMAFLKLKRFSEKHLGIIIKTFVTTHGLQWYYDIAERGKGHEWKNVLLNKVYGTFLSADVK